MNIPFKPEESEPKLVLDLSDFSDEFPDAAKILARRNNKERKGSPGAHCSDFVLDSAIRNMPSSVSVAQTPNAAAPSSSLLDSRMPVRDHPRNDICNGTQMSPHPKKRAGFERSLFITSSPTKKLCTVIPDLTATHFYRISRVGTPGAPLLPSWMWFRRRQQSRVLK